MNKLLQFLNKFRAQKEVTKSFVAPAEVKTIVAIPFAGGDRYSYRALAKVLPPEVSLHVLELPGRGRSRNQTRLRDIHAMVAALYEQWNALYLHQPYALLGHSMGGMLAYELMLKLQKQGYKLPERAWISSIPGPGVEREKKVSHLPSDEFWKAMRAYRGVPDAIIANSEMRDYFEPVLRDDFHAIEHYHLSEETNKPLSVPLHVAWGRSESLSESQMNPWRHASSKKVEFSTFPGHHFFIFDELNAVIETLLGTKE